MSTPVTQTDENAGQCQDLSDLYPDVKAENVGDEAVLGQRQFLEFGGQAEAMKQTKDEYRGLGVGLKPKEALEAIHVVKSFVDDRKTDDGIDNIGVRVNTAQDPSQ